MDRSEACVSWRCQCHPHHLLCGQVPELHPLLLGNPLFPIFLPQMESWNQVLQFTLKAVNSRSSLQRDRELKQDEADEGKDMLSKWIAIHHADPEKMSTTDVIVHLSTTSLEGSGTTAIALRAVFYSLLRHSKILSKLRDEIDTATHGRRLSNPISYRESATHLPHLNAVLKEATPSFCGTDPRARSALGRSVHLWERNPRRDSSLHQCVGSPSRPASFS